MAKTVRPAPNRYFCMAPWTHTYLSPQSERRLCCGSRETSEFVKQYLDLPGEPASNHYEPESLESYWNSERVRAVRRRMLKGEASAECQVCDKSELSLSTYRHWFTTELFNHKIDEVKRTTDESGFTSMKPISFDYRFSNLCNFRCRTCGDQFSSAWENENRAQGDYSVHRPPWTEPAVRERIREFQNTVVEEEFAQAVREKRIEEIYWVGGEPLYWEQHWKYMKEIVDLNYADQVYARYNTNLSQIERGGVRLFKDLLPHFKNYMVSASIDGAGPVGEWVRTGLNWKSWLAGFEEGVRASRGRADTSMIMDVTLSLPGLLGMKALFDEAVRLDVRMEVKVMYAFDPFVVLSPHAPPKEIRDEILMDLIEYIEPGTNDKNRPLLNTLKSMLGQPSFAELYPENHRTEFLRGREYMQKIGERRGDGHGGRLSLTEIYSSYPALLNWWTSSSSN